jgi:GT2 family glycosyltransferase
MTPPRHLALGLRWRLVLGLEAGWRAALPPRLRCVLGWLRAGQLPRHARDWLACRLPRRAAPPAAAPPVATAPAPEAIRLPRPEADPVVSILITSYGQVPLTLRCLAALAADDPGVPVEILLSDDAAPDPDTASLARVRHLRLSRNPERLGYLRSVNALAAAARGEFLLLLNNDTEPRPGAVAAMLALLRARPDAGAVGAKLLWPDGRLQEAGGIVWRDGSAWNWGRGEDPERAEFNYVREVDYCSAAALMIPRAIFAALGGFDPAFAPAYCEDSDLAFRLRAAGYKVLYQPEAVVVHVEGASHGTDPTQGGKLHQTLNRARFLRRWGAELAARHAPNGQRVLRARERGFGRPLVLVVDHYVPEPDRDAGSRTVAGFLEALADSGAMVKFWPANGADTPGYAAALRRRGVDVLTGAGSLPRWLARHGDELDLALLSRPEVALEALPALRRLSRARIVYYGHDLHFHRLRLAARRAGPRDTKGDAAAARMERIERWVWREVDRVLYPSDAEAITAAGMEPGIDARTVPAFGFAQFGAERDPPAGADILFVGGFAHPPNAEALDWFVGAILPRIRAVVPAARLVIAGSHPTQAVRALVGPGIVLHADVSAAALRDLYAAARVAVAPLLVGAGVKLKVVEALAEGTPLVTTPIGAQGLSGLPAGIAASAEAFADAVAVLLTDDAAWRARNRAALAYARAELGMDAMRRGVLAAVGLDAPTPAARAA